MMPASPLLSRWYGALSLLAIAATLQALLLPRWPRAAALDRAALEQALRSAGVEARALPSGPATRSLERASSPLLVWRLAGGEELRLMRASSRQWSHLQAAFLARAQPSLPLKDRRLERSPVVGAYGRNDGRWARLTCLLPDVAGPPRFGVTHTQLAELASGAPPSLRRRVLQQLGLPPAQGQSCVLIALRSPAGRPLPDSGRWQRLLTVVAAPLLPVAGETSSSAPTRAERAL